MDHDPQVEAETKLPTDMALLTEEYLRVAGPNDVYGKHIQDRNQMHIFLQTKPGQRLAGGAIKAALAAIDVMLDVNMNQRSVLAAVVELRVQNRVLQSISAALNEGRLAETAILLEESPPQENPDEHASE